MNESNSLTIVSTLLWFLLCWLTYRSGKAAGHSIGYAKALDRSKELMAVKLQSARVAGRLDAWRELSDMITETHDQITADTDDSQVH